MSTDANAAALVAILDALTLVQGQLDAVGRGNARIEAAQAEIISRLDGLDARQAGVNDVLPALETILARSIEDRQLIREQFTTVASVAAFAHAAATGNSAPLPIGIADDSLLERFVLTQPADRASHERAIAEWRRVSSATATIELISLLARQYKPSPTDTPETRILRYQLAAISRAEIEGRGAVPPSPPASTIAQNSSALADSDKSEELARLWRAGESVALFAEPELAGAIDLFAAAELRWGGSTDEQVSAELARLHRDLGERLSAGERPSAKDLGPTIGDELFAVIEPEQRR